MKKYKIAIVGATGLVGRSIIGLLEKESNIEKLYLLASQKSAGSTIKFGNELVLVEDVAQFDPRGIDIAFFSAGGSVSSQYAPKFASSGAMVIDNTSHYRYDDDIPLIVPEVNANALALHKKRNIIANPNCSTIQMLLAIAPIHERYQITNVQVATYQAVSGAGNSAVEVLKEESRLFLNDGKHTKLEGSKLPSVIGFNVIPQIDVMREDGFTKEEWKMKVETKKILDASIEVSATCVRVPVVSGHSEAIFLETRESLPSVEDIYDLYNGKIGVLARKQGFDEPIYAEGKDEVFVSRIRKIDNNRLCMWCVSDNLRKGASLNAVQIFTALQKNGFI